MNKLNFPLLSELPEVVVPYDERLELEADRMLRREAGEGWHPEGMNAAVLGVLVTREHLLDRLNLDEALVRNVPSGPDYQKYQTYVQFAGVLKEGMGIGDPPPPESAHLEARQ